VDGIGNKAEDYPNMPELKMFFSGRINALKELLKQ